MISTLNDSLQNSALTQASPSPLPPFQVHSFSFKGGLSAFVLDSANQVVTQAANQ